MRQNIYGKLGAHNRLEAVARCRALGLLDKDAVQVYSKAT